MDKMLFCKIVDLGDLIPKIQACQNIDLESGTLTF